MQAKHGAHFLSAAQLELAQSAPLLDPAEHLLDPAAGVDRFAVALVARGAAVDRRTTGAIGVLSLVRRDTDATHLRDKAPGVVILVGAKSFLVGTETICSHRFGGIPLPGAHRLGDAAVQDQRMAVVHEHMAPVARLGRMSDGLPSQQGVGVCAGAMGLVAELDAAEIPFGSLLAGLWSAKTLTRT